MKRSVVAHLRTESKSVRSQRQACLILSCALPAHCFLDDHTHTHRHTHTHTTKLRHTRIRKGGVRTGPQNGPLGASLSRGSKCLSIKLFPFLSSRPVFLHFSSQKRKKQQSVLTYNGHSKLPRFAWEFTEESGTVSWFRILDQTIQTNQESPKALENLPNRARVFWRQ